MKFLVTPATALSLAQDYMHDVHEPELNDGMAPVMAAIAIGEWDAHFNFADPIELSESFEQFLDNRVPSIFREQFSLPVSEVQTAVRLGMSYQMLKERAAKRNLTIAFEVASDRPAGEDGLGNFIFDWNVFICRTKELEIYKNIDLADCLAKFVLPKTTDNYVRGALIVIALILDRMGYEVSPHLDSPEIRQLHHYGYHDDFLLDVPMSKVAKAALRQHLTLTRSVEEQAA